MTGEELAALESAVFDSEVVTTYSVEVVRLDEGEELIGYYLGSRAFRSKFGRGAVFFHYFWGAEGLKGLWGSAVLDQALRSLRRGQAVRVRYLGRRHLGGGRTMNDYRIHTSATYAQKVPMLAAGDVGAEGVDDEVFDAEFIETSFE